MKFSDVRWLYFRLRAMSAGEVVHRFWEQAKRSFDSRRTFKFDDTPIALPVIPGLRDRVRACSDGARRQFRAAANDVRDGRYHFLGRDWPMMGDLPDWHLDPVSGRRWPDHMFCYSVPFRHNAEYGDVKYVWELNRLQHLQYMAAAAACDDDLELARFCISQIRSWIDANPPFQGLNWCSGIELALRTVSIVIVLSLVPQSSISEDDRRDISASLRAHSYWLQRYPSRFSSANNHLIAEAGGLFLLGLLLPELPEAQKIQEYGRKVLNTEAVLQFCPEGVPAEQSPTYGAFSAEWLLLAHAIALGMRAQGLANAALQRLSEFGTFLSWITDKRGNIPRIGDDDEGRVVFGEKDSNSYVASIKNAAISVCGNSLTDVPTCQSLRSAVLSLSGTSLRVPEANATGVRTFLIGGYTVVKESADGKECLLVFDHGPLGYLGIAAHGHADALAIWAHYDGRPVLVDAGTYLYHSGGKWREFFRGTVAHSTVALNNSDQSVQSGNFNWSSKANVQLVSSRQGLDGFFIEAEHDGYEERLGVRHKRSIERLAPGRYAVRDTLSHTSVHPPFCADVSFIVSGDLHVEPYSTGWKIECSTGLLMTIDCPEANERAIASQLEKPEVAGWMSCSFGAKQPAWRLIASYGNDARDVLSLIKFGPSG